jgi:biopolymer transport protein ExbB
MDISLLAHGGVVMLILGGLSVYAISVILYKAYQFIASSALSVPYMDSVMASVKRGEVTEALERLKPYQGPQARVMRTALEAVRNRDMSMRSREAEIGRVGAQEVHQLESHMRGLEMVATTAPLLGLLGTVIGMVSAFSQLSSAGSRVDPSMLAGGIWEALLTTVGGLIVAIPAVAAYYIIDGLIEKIRTQMKDAAVQILSLEDMFLRNEKEQERIAAERAAKAMLEQEQQRMSEQEKRMNDQQRAQLELLERERQLRQAIEEQERAVATMRSAPRATNTLRLLNPTYNKF